MEFLFQRVWIRYGVRGLLESLKGSMRSEGYGRYVRRLELPSRPINHDAMNPIRFVDILACCPYLRVLVKPAFYGNIGSDFWSNHIPAEQPQINDVVLTSLKHLDWTSCGYKGQDTFLGSHSVLSSIILRSPNLRYVSLSWLPGPIFKDVDRTGYPVLLPSLKTLNFEGDPGLNHRGIQNGDFPNLTHLVLRPFDLHMIGPQLRTVEFHEDLRGGDHLDPFFKLFSKLQEFAFHVGFPALQSSPLLQHFELKAVHLQIESINHLRETYEAEDLSWEMFGKTFAFFSAHAFPALQHIILHGEWDSVVHDGQFRSLRQFVLDRGCSLEYPDGTPVPVR